MNIVYTKDNCAACKRTKAMMDSHGIEYEAVDITHNLEIIDYLRDSGYSQLPVVELSNGESWEGYQPGRIKGLANGS